MYKLIKNLAPLVLVVFIFSFVIGNGHAFTEEEVWTRVLVENEKREPILIAIYPDTIVYLRVQAKYKDKLLKEIQMAPTDAFELLEREEKIFTNPLFINSSETKFKIKTPSQTGEYTLVFSGKNNENELMTFTKKIEIKYEPPLIVIGRIILGIIVIYGLCTILDGISKTG